MWAHQLKGINREAKDGSGPTRGALMNPRKRYIHDLDALMDGHRQNEQEMILVGGIDVNMVCVCVLCVAEMPLDFQEHDL